MSTTMETRTKDVVPFCVGESDTFYADFDPPNMDPNRRILDGRMIASATASLMDGAAGSITDVAPIQTDTTVNGVLMAAGTAVKFKASGLQPGTDGAETLVKILAELSDGAVKPLVFRFLVEP